MILWNNSQLNPTNEYCRLCSDALQATGSVDKISNYKSTANYK